MLQYHGIAKSRTRLSNWALTLMLLFIHLFSHSLVPPSSSSSSLSPAFVVLLSTVSPVLRKPRSVGGKNQVYGAFNSTSASWVTTGSYSNSPYLTVLLDKPWIILTQRRLSEKNQINCWALQALNECQALIYNDNSPSQSLKDLTFLWDWNRGLYKSISLFFRSLLKLKHIYTERHIYLHFYKTRHQDIWTQLPYAK